MKILAPNKNYSGESAGIQFQKGVGYTNDENLIGWFKERGYKVVKGSEPAADSNNVGDQAENDSDVKNPEFGFEDDFPAKDIFEAESIALGTVARMTKEELVAIKGIGAKTADQVIEAVKAIYGEEKSE